MLDLSLMDQWGLGSLKAIKDAEAEMWILTGPDWAYFIQQALRNAERSILLSIYLLSPHWNKQRPGNTNLVTEMCNASHRLSAKNGTCRAVLGQPGKSGHTATYNQEAAAIITAAGWSVRMMRPAVTLHEKVWILDEVLSLVGSHNLSRSSAVTNLDTSIAINSEKIASVLKTTWWNRWNAAERYRATGEQNGEGYKPKHPNRSASRLQTPGRAAQRRIV